VNYYYCDTNEYKQIVVNDNYVMHMFIYDIHGGWGCSVGTYTVEWGGDGDRHNGDGVGMGKQPVGTDEDGDNLMSPCTCLVDSK